MGVNNLPRVAIRQCAGRESNLRPLDHKSNALPLHYRAGSVDRCMSVTTINIMINIISHRAHYMSYHGLVTCFFRRCAFSVTVIAYNMTESLSSDMYIFSCYLSHCVYEQADRVAFINRLNDKLFIFILMIQYDDKYLMCTQKLTTPNENKKAVLSQR